MSSDSWVNTCVERLNVAIKCSSIVCQEMTVSNMRLDLVSVIEETSIDVNEKCIYFMTVSRSLCMLLLYCPVLTHQMSLAYCSSK